MGYSTNISCGQCDYKKHFTLGIGMMYNPATVFYGDKPTITSLVKNRAIVKKALELIQGGGSPGDYGHEIYGCPRCKKLNERFYFSIMMKEEKFEPQYKCPACKQTQIRISESEIAEWPCPSCGNKSLSSGPGGVLWD